MKVHLFAAVILSSIALITCEDDVYQRVAETLVDQFYINTTVLKEIPGYPGRSQPSKDNLTMARLLYHDNKTYFINVTNVCLERIPSAKLDYVNSKHVDPELAQQSMQMGMYIGKIGLTAQVSYQRRIWKHGNCPWNYKDCLVPFGPINNITVVSQSVEQVFAGGFIFFNTTRRVIKQAVFMSLDQFNFQTKIPCGSNLCTKIHDSVNHLLNIVYLSPYLSRWISEAIHRSSLDHL